jgi:hypothetical protein
MQYIPFEDLPPEIQAQIAADYQARELASMDASAERHEFWRMLNTLDENQLRAQTSMFHTVGEHENHLASYFEGAIAALLESRFDICFACGRNHKAEEAALLSEATINKFVKQFDEEGVTPLHTPETIMDHLVKQDEATEPEPTSTTSESFAHYVPLTITPVDFNGEIDGQWPRNVLTDYPEFHAKADEYRVNLLTDQYPAVVCANCGQQYPSLEDRMINPPDECSGCAQKEKWG